ncbi:MAG: hypothetical protein OSB10_08100 [Planctomycetota bacterium]|nr:hypothetical protein [Planctomycetota bacterium]
MRTRPPSIGLLYLILAAGGFVAYFAYIRAPMWWELKDWRERELAELRYLIDIAETGKPWQQKTWLSDAMKLASKYAEWELAESILTFSLANKIKINRDVLIEVVPGKCWVAGTAPQQRTVGKASIAFFGHNDGDQAYTLETQWTSTRDGAAQTREAGKQWQSHAIKAKADTAVEWSIPAGKTTYWEVRADAAMYTAKDKPDGPFQGIELKGVKAKS